MLKKFFTIWLIFLLLTSMIIFFIPALGQENSYGIRIVAPPDVDESTEFIVTIEYLANSTKVVGADVTFNNETKQTNESGKVRFTAPEVEANKGFIINARDVTTRTSSLAALFDSDEVWFSIPLIPDGSAEASELLGFDCTNRLYAWDDTGKTYLLYPDDFTDLQVGNSYLLYFNQGEEYISAYEGTHPDMPFERRLPAAGRSWVGVPGTYDILGLDLEVEKNEVRRTPNEDRDAADPWIDWNWTYWDPKQNTSKIMNPFGEGYDDSLHPWYGYRIWSYTEDVTIIFPAPTPATKTITVKNKETPSPELSISAPSMVLEGEEFYVTVTADGSPIENAIVGFNNSVYSTDTDGKVYLIASYVSEDTQYIITATKEGYQSNAASIYVLNNETKLKGWIYGVVDNSTSLLENVRIIISSDSKSWSTFTDADGGYYQSIPAGTYKVTASLQGYKTKTKGNITVNENVANEVNFILVKQPSSIEEEMMDYIDYTIQQKGFEGIIGARMDIDEEESILFYSDALSIELNTTEEYVSFTIYAEDDTPGTILVIRIGEGVLGDLDNLKVTYDGMSINESNNVEEFFNIQGTITPSWLRFLTMSGLYVFVKVPHFSEHTITISSIVEAIGGISALISYIIIGAVVGIVIVIPIILIERKESE